MSTAKIRHRRQRRLRARRAKFLALWEKTLRAWYTPEVIDRLIANDMEAEREFRRG